MRILIIDDDEDLRNLLAHYIRGRWADAVAAWKRALDGDGGIDRPAIEKKITDAQSKLPR